jgi:nucleoid-associated protein YgaU
MTRVILFKILLILVAGASAIIPVQHLMERRARKPVSARPAKAAADPALDKTAATATTPVDASAKATSPTATGVSAAPDAKESAPAAGVATKPAPVSTSAPATPPAHRSYVVKEGDSLWSIAEKELGSGKYANKLIDANRGRIDPNNLKVGQVVIIPDVNADVPRFR